MEQETISMEVINPQAAGIDVGSRYHWVAVGQSEQDVREYGVFNQDLFDMADWLKEKESTPLRDFFQRISFRKGRVSAISATARKLAVIIWNIVVKGVPYINPEGYLFLDQKRKLGLVKRIKKHPVTYGTVSPKTIWASKQLKFKGFEVR